jgi:hypothetical protein
MLAQDHVWLSVGVTPPRERWDLSHTGHRAKPKTGLSHFRLKLMLLPGLAFLLTVAGPPGNSMCASYVGQPVVPQTFDQVRSAVPEMAPRSSYESTADYGRRLAEADGRSQEPLIIRRVGSRESEGLSYDADRHILSVYRSAFGLGEINFSDIPSLRTDDARSDNFTGAIGFLISAGETGQETYEATNAYGARITVTRTRRQVSAIWESSGRMDQSQFIGTAPFKPVAQLRMGPDAARDIIEGGSTALLFVPKAPFQASGTSTVEASFSHPRERVDTISVIIADVRCAFLLDRVGNVLHAFEVR